MKFTIKSRKMGKTFIFWMPQSGGYIRLGSGTTDPQICEGGGFMGSTLSAPLKRFVADGTDK